MVKPRLLIFFLIIIAIIVASYSFLRHPGELAKQQVALQQEATPLPTPKRTGTFVDTLVGNVIFFLNGHLYQISLPTQIVKQLAGIDDQLIEQFPKQRPAFSSDGTLFVFASSAKTIAVVKYDTGTKQTIIHLDQALDETKHPEISVSPDGATVVLRQDDGASKLLTFYSATDGTKISTQSSCGPIGFWLQASSIYVSSCQYQGVPTIVGMNAATHFSPVPVTRDSSYKLLNSYNSTSVVVEKGKQLGSLTMDAKYTPVDLSKYKEVPSVESIMDPMSALKNRIQQKLHTDIVDDVAVSSDTTYLIFHTSRGLWIEDVHLNNAPYFLIEGTLPVIVP